MNINKVKQEGVHTKQPLFKHSFCTGEESLKQHLLQQESSATGGWRSQCRGAGRRRTLTGRDRWCKGEDSPVSVILAASKHLMQVSHPSSASTSMEHPVHQGHLHLLSPAPDHHLFHFSSHEEPYAPAGSLSERVQQAFSKSHELTAVKGECNLNFENVKKAISRSQIYNAKVKPWANYTKGRMEWLNLQEDPPLTPNAIHSKVYVQSHTFASSPDDEGEGFSMCSSTRDQDEESVIDFFPSANMRPSSAMQLRRRSYDRVNDTVEKGTYNQDKEDVKRVSLLKSGRRMKRSGGGGPQDDDDDAAEEGEDGGCARRKGGRVSCSSKWDEAERWLICSGRAGPPPPPNDLHSSTLLPKAGALQLVQAATAQDKHVSENSREPKVRGGSHGSTAATRETGTEMGSESMRDMATQSTPTDWSGCQSPETANLSTAAERKATASLEKVANKTSPPRHNTPARRSVSCSKQSATKQCAPAHFNNGKLNLLELENCHLDKLKLAHDLPLGTSTTWQLYPDEDIGHSLKLLEHNSPAYENSKNLQHAKVNMLEARVSAWEDVERAKHMAKFKREEAKIEAWESLQRAEADAELRKLEVKLEKLRFEGREKIMGRLGAAQRRAQEMRGAAEAHKVEQLTRVGMRANHIRKSGHLPSSTFNVVCNLTTKIKTTSNLSFS